VKAHVKAKPTVSRKGKSTKARPAAAGGKRKSGRKTSNMTSHEKLMRAAANIDRGVSAKPIKGFFNWF
jgi:hypothetical protein